MPSTAAVDDEYAVYSAVIESLYLTDEVEQIVLIEQTESGAETGGSVEEVTQYVQENFGSSILEETLADYLQKHEQPVQLEQQFVLPVEYVLINEAEVDRLVDESGNWQLFFEAYPTSTGVITLSPVGFNQAGDQALVYTGFRGDYGSGQGYYILLIKQDDRWRVDQMVVAWIS
jgi:hypothetical protein